MIKLDIHLKNDFDSKYIGVEITREDILQLACGKAKGRYMENYWHTITADEDTMTINLKG